MMIADTHRTSRARGASVSLVQNRRRDRLLVCEGGYEYTFRRAWNGRIPTEDCLSRLVIQKILRDLLSDVES